MRTHDLLLLPFLLLLASGGLLITGCGTIRGGSSEVIEVGVPRDMEVMVIDSSGWMKGLPRFDRERGVITLDLQTGRTLLFEFRTAVESDSVLFPSSLESGYVLPNLIFFPTGSLIDGATNSLYSFDRSWLLFRGEYEGADSAELVIHDVTDSIERMKPYHIGGRRYMFGLHVGIKSQYAESQTHGLHFGYTFGVRFSETFGLLYHGTHGGWLEYGWEHGVAMAAERHAQTLDLRLYPPFLGSSRSYAGLYLGGTIGWSWYESSRLLTTEAESILAKDGFSQSMGTGGWAFGYSVPSAYIEVYCDYGFEKLDLVLDSGERIVVPVRNPGFRWGLYFEF